LKDCPEPDGGNSADACGGQKLVYRHETTADADKANVLANSPGTFRAVECVALLALLLITLGAAASAQAVRPIFFFASLILFDLHSVPIFLLKATQLRSAKSTVPVVLESVDEVFFWLAVALNVFGPMATFRRLRGERLLPCVGWAYAAAVIAFFVWIGPLDATAAELLVLFDRQVVRGSPVRVILGLLGIVWFSLFIDTQIQRHVGSVHQTFAYSLNRLRGIGWEAYLSAILVLCFCFSIASELNTIDHRWFTWAIRVAFIVAVSAILFGALRILGLWKAISAILAALGREGAADNFKKTLEAHGDLKLDLRRKLFTGSSGYTWQNFSDPIDKGDRQKAVDSLCDWLHGRQKGGAKSSGETGDAKSQEVRLQVAHDKATVAAVVELLTAAFAAMRGMAIFNVLGCVILIWAIDLYPLEPHRLLHLGCWAASSFVFLVGILILVELSADPMLQAITGNKKGHLLLEWPVVLRLFPLIGVFVFQLFSTHFPLEVGKYSGLFDALTRTLK
jgi:hypothetical protein